MSEYRGELQDPRLYRAWPLEDIPSTRESIRPLTKFYPIDLTLAVSGTAENLFVVSPGLPTVNLITNPSAETGDPPTGYTADGAAISQSAVVAYAGSNSLLINPNNAADNEGAYWDLGSFPPRVPLICSAYFQDNVNSGNQALIQIRDSSGNIISTGNTIALSNAWQRSIAQISEQTLQAPTSLRAYLITGTQHNTNFYVDGIQAEVRDSVSPYCDGAQGIYHYWDGTAHASVSRRYRSIFEIREFTFHVTRDTYIAFDREASRTEANQQNRGVWVRAGSDFWSQQSFALNYRISMINSNLGEQPRVTGWIVGI